MPLPRHFSRPTVAVMSAQPQPSPVPIPLPTAADVDAAAARLAGVALHTPLISSPVLDALTGGRVLLKAETLQRTGSFKFRGAYNKLSSIPPADRKRGVVAAPAARVRSGLRRAAGRWRRRSRARSRVDAGPRSVGTCERAGEKLAL